MKDIDINQVAKDLSGLIGVIDRVMIRPVELKTRTVISPLPYLTLRILSGKKAITMSELAREVQIAKPQLTLIIDKLIDSNYVTREYDRSDRRTTKVKISEDGLIFLDQFNDLVIEIIKGNINQLDKDDVNNLSEAIRLFKDVILKIRLKTNDGEIEEKNN